MARFGPLTSANERSILIPEHPNKEINAVLKIAYALGWRIEISNGHAWGKIYCPCAQRGGCLIQVWSTPRNPENHAKRLQKLIDTCPHEVE
jgi:hypothetical protein